MKWLDLDFDAIYCNQEVRERMIKEILEKKKQNIQLNPNEAWEKTKYSDAAKDMEEKGRPLSRTNFLDTMLLFGLSSVHEPAEEASSNSKEEATSTSGIAEAQDKTEE